MDHLEEKSLKIIKGRLRRTIGAEMKGTEYYLINRNYKLHVWKRTTLYNEVM